MRHLALGILRASRLAFHEHRPDHSPQSVRRRSTRRLFSRALASGLTHSTEGAGVTQHFANADVVAIDGIATAECLGTGAFGETWRLETDEGVTLARKLLHRPGYDVARLDREVQGLRRVTSPHVVALLGVGQSTVGRRTVPHLDFEFIQGDDLQKWVEAGGTVDAEEAVALASGLLQGVVALHQAQVLHRDIKPANIGLRNGDPRSPVLLDLGLAKLLDIESITRYPTLVGTAMYASPEQLQGERAVKASDVWSIGVVLHEVLSGRHPFFTIGEHLTLTELLERLGNPPPLPAGVPPAVEELVVRCLQPEPYQRGNAAPAYRRLLKETGQ